MKTILLTTLLLFGGLCYGQGHLVFFDDFHDNRWDWPEFSHDDADAKLNHGRYEFNHKRESGGWTVSNSIAIDESKPWLLEVSIGHLKGIDNNGYSVLFGRKGQGYYQFSITGNKHYSIAKYVDGNFNKIVDWIKKETLIKSAGELNLVQVKHNNKRWEFIINGEKVYDMPAEKFFGESFGFKIADKQSITIEYVKIFQDGSPIAVVPDVPINLVKENLGRNVNSEWSETMPIIAPDGKTLYFTRKEFPLNIVNNRDDIWQSIYENGKWTKAVHLPHPINQNFHNTVISVLPDNNSMLLMNRYKPDGNGHDGSGISMTSRNASGGWNIPTNIDILNYLNESGYTESNLSSNGKVLVISLHRGDTQNQEEKDSRDIYVCFRNDDGTFSEPVNLGPDINTPKGELSPFLAADNKTLYFSSHGWPGYGSADIFMARRLDDTWQKWSKPQNLGMGINTSAWDAYFNIPASGEYAYMVSSNNSIGSSDVFRVKLPPVLMPEPVVLVSGVVYDSKTKLPIGARVTYTDIVTAKEAGIASSDPISGAYQIVLPLGKQYAFRAEKDGYYPVSEYLDVRELAEYKEITKDLYMGQLLAGQTIRINNIFFEFNKSELKQESFEELNYLVRVLNSNPTLRIELGGHTDSKGADDYNLKLSSDRAASVKTFLVGKGIEASRLVSKGYGKSKPVATNNTEEGQAQNRRVEFTIL